MDLQISVFLLFILFTAGHSLECYECSSLTGSCAVQTAKTCPIGCTQCASGTTMAQVGGITSTVKEKACAAAGTCQSQSFNLGVLRSTSSCCNTNLCNLQEADPVPTGKKCYYCDDKSCSNTVDCSGTEDRCIKGTGTFGGESLVFKGCASKSICDATTSVKGIESISCCEGNLCNGAQSVTQSITTSCKGNLCNGAQSVTQSFLFLCCSLLSYFMMH